MRNFLSFWWRCIRLAFWGNAAFANDWQWVIASPLWQSIGSAIGAALGTFVSRYWRGAPMMSIDTPLGVFLGGLFGFVVTWAIAFVVRLANAPVRLHQEEHQESENLKLKLAGILGDVRVQLDILHEDGPLFGREIWRPLYFGNSPHTYDERLIIVKNLNTVRSLTNVEAFIDAVDGARANIPLLDNPVSLAPEKEVYLTVVLREPVDAKKPLKIDPEKPTKKLNSPLLLEQGGNIYSIDGWLWESRIVLGGTEKDHAFLSPERHRFRVSVFAHDCPRASKWFHVHIEKGIVQMEVILDELQVCRFEDELESEGTKNVGR